MEDCNWVEKSGEQSGRGAALQISGGSILYLSIIHHNVNKQGYYHVNQDRVISPSHLQNFPLYTLLNKNLPIPFWKR